MAGVDGVDESQETVRSRAQGPSTRVGAGVGGRAPLLPESARLPKPALGHLANGPRGQGCAEGPGLGRDLGGSVLEVNPKVALASGAPRRVGVAGTPSWVGPAPRAPALSLAQVCSEEPGVDNV